MILAEENPSDGTVFFESINIHKLKNNDLTKLRRRIGVVFQDFKRLVGADLPAGKYVLSLYLERNPSLSLTEYRFTVPTVNHGDDPEPVSLGDMMLEKR